MDPARFDTLTKSLGQARSRRSVLTTLGGATLGAIGLADPGRRVGAATGGNSAAAQWCHAHFSGAAAGQCTRQAAQGTGPYYRCPGPGACPAGQVCLSNGSCAVPCPHGDSDCQHCGGRCITTSDGPVCAAGGLGASSTNLNSACPAGSACSGAFCENVATAC
jgi:hypothetical protein